MFLQVWIACLPIMRGQDGHSLLTAANNARYRAKYAGQNDIKLPNYQIMFDKCPNSCYTDYDKALAVFWQCCEAKFVPVF